MKSARIFLLDDYEGARAAELFARTAPQRGDNRLMAVAAALLAAILLAAFVGMAYAAEPDSPTWQGQVDERGKAIAFTLRYDHARPLVHIDGPKYGCLLTGGPALRGSTTTAKVYSVTSSGGGCDALLGGRMEIDSAPGPGSDLLLRTFTSEGEKRHELGLQKQSGHSPDAPSHHEKSN